MRNQIPKLDCFGLYARIEAEVLQSLEVSIRAALTVRSKKLVLVQDIQLHIEVGKRLTRLAWELGILKDNKYLTFEKHFVRISKMASGWIKYLHKEA